MNLHEILHSAAVVVPVDEGIHCDVVSHGQEDSWSSYWATHTPTTLVATVVSDTEIGLTWTDAAEAADGIRIYYSTDNVTFTEHGTANFGDQAYSVTGLDDGIRYYFRVVAYKDANESDAITDDEYTLFAFALAATGTGTGVATVRMMFDSNQTVTLTDSAKFYSDSGGTAGESATWEVTTGANYRTIYLKCTTGISKMLFKGQNLIAWGYDIYSGWVASTNAPSITANIAVLPKIAHFAISGTSVITGYPNTLVSVDASGSAITWTGTGNITAITNRFRLEGTGIALTLIGMPSEGITWFGISDVGAGGTWTHEGAFPSTLQQLRLKGNGIYWTHTGPFPSILTYLLLTGSHINWTYIGALPTGLTYLGMYDVSNLAWSHDGAMPVALTLIRLDSANMNWTGLDFTGTGNITTFLLSNYRQTKMSSADMVTLLTSLTNRVGNLPNTITINDYADYASPPSEVTNAVAALKAAKTNVTTVNLGA